MPYKVYIKNKKTKEIVTAQYDWEWKESSYFFWTEGSFGCDCNRHREFLRAKEKTPDLNDVPCGENLYSIEKVVLEDGTEIKVDQ